VPAVLQRRSDAYQGTWSTGLNLKAKVSDSITIVMKCLFRLSSGSCDRIAKVFVV